jgi:cytochrome c peroxidase
VPDPVGGRRSGGRRRPGGACDGRRPPRLSAAAAFVTASLAAAAFWALPGTAAPAAAAPGPQPAAWEWRLPPGFPVPRVPADNPMSAAKVALGRRLFYDDRLSGNRTQACATCHRQAQAFTDGRPHAIGSTGEIHRRGAMSLANVAYAVSLTWADPGIRRLEDQALVPLLGTHPVEMGMGGRESEIVARLTAEPLYGPLFAAAFPGASQPIRIENVTRAIAAFERTLISGDAPYDHLVYRDDRNALDEAARRGMRLFFSDRLACSRCHAGPTFSGPIDYEGTERLRERPRPLFHNTGLYDLDGRGAYPPDDTGLEQVTGRRRDMGKFKAPTLRNIALTAPYMHDGSIATLEEVVAHYARGGRAGSTSRMKSVLVTGFAITDAETSDLVAFLRSLTDETFVSDPRLADPWQD